MQFVPDWLSLPPNTTTTTGEIVTTNSHFHTKEEIVIPTTTEDIAAPEIVHDTDMTFNPTQTQSDFKDPPPSTEDTAIDAWSGNFESYFLSFVDIVEIN